MKPEVKRTTDYTLFKMNEHQQPMSTAHINRLVASMEKYGYLPSKPLTVIPSGLHLRIIDGHHRLAAAKELGIPVYYVIEDKAVAPCIGEINYAVKKWSAESFAKMYAAGGSEDYRTLMHYVGLGFPMQQAGSMLILHCAGSGNASKDVRAGSFKVKSTALVDAIVSIWDRAAHVAPEIKRKAFIEAYSALYFVPEFDTELFVKRLLNNPMMMVKCSTREQMLDVIEDIYNFRTHDKVPVKHWALQKMKERRDVGTLRKNAA